MNLEDAEMRNTRLISASPGRDSMFNENRRPEHKQGPGPGLLGYDSDQSLMNCDLGPGQWALCPSFLIYRV